jgi:hypothetical protein
LIQRRNGRLAQPAEQLTLNQRVTGSNPVSPSKQTLENKSLTETDNLNGKSENQNLVSGLFSTIENDQELRLIVEKWPVLPKHIKAAIKALLQTNKMKEKT